MSNHNDLIGNEFNQSNQLADFNLNQNECNCEKYPQILKKINKKILSALEVDFNQDISKKDLGNDDNYYESNSSSENEEDIYDKIIPIFNDIEFEAFVERIPSVITTLSMIGPNRNNNPLVNTISKLMKPDKFFVDLYETKINLLKTAPNSFFPILNRTKDDIDLFAPTYMISGEVKEFVKPLKPNPSVYKSNLRGLEFNYTTDKKEDFESQYVMLHRLIYGKVCQDNLINSKKKKSEQEQKQLQFPISIYESKTFLKRFCDLFSFFPCVIKEIYDQFIDEKYMIKKILMTIVCGLHKFICSQGMPLTALPGETYEVVKDYFYLFAEVRKSKPIKIVYNIRWKGRSVTIDGWAEISYEFIEKSDKINVFLDSYNRMVVQKNLSQSKKIENIEKIEKKNKGIKRKNQGPAIEDKKKKKEVEKEVGNERVFEFNFPKKFSMEGIVETLDRKIEGMDNNFRIIYIDSFIFLKGFIYCGFLVFNYFENADIFGSFTSMINRPILNQAEELYTGHNFIGLIIHLSGFSVDSLKNKNSLLDIINIKKVITNEDKIVKTNQNNEKMESKISSIKLKKENVNEKINTKEYFIEISKIKEDNKSSKEKVAIINKEKENIISSNSKDKQKISSPIIPIKDSNSLINIKQLNISVNGVQNEIKSKSEEEKILNITNKNLNSSEKIINNTSENNKVTNKTSETQSFLNIIDLMHRNIKTNDGFVSCFNSNFVSIIIFGSWVKLNFFEVNLSNCEIYQNFLVPITNFRPPVISLETGIMIQNTENQFFGLKEYKKTIGKLWEPVILPLPTDTRFREDLIWLLRYYSNSKSSFAETSEDIKKEYDKKRNEAIKSASKWKDLLEGFVLSNISSKIDVKIK